MRLTIPYLLTRELPSGNLVDRHLELSGEVTLVDGQYEVTLDRFLGFYDLKASDISAREREFCESALIDAFELARAPYVMEAA